MSLLERSRVTHPMRWLAMTAVAVALAGCGQRGGTLESAAKALGAQNVQSIEFAGTGRWFQFGQAPRPDLPWPAFDVSSYTATVSYAIPAARVQITRKQAIEAGRNRPVPVEQKPDQYVSGTAAWNLAAPQGSPEGSPPEAQPQPAAVEERIAEIWATPQGFLRAALANQATSKPLEKGSEVTFTADGHQYVGVINANDELVSVKTWIDNPVLGDTPVEFTYSEYKQYEGVKFPARIVRNQGGHPVLDLKIDSATANAPVNIKVPEKVSGAATVAAAITVTSEPLATGVYYLKGGTHHSVAIEQADHVVVVEAPQHEARSEAVIAKVKEIIPGKPITVLINTHHHFDHSGGLRTYVDAGASILTHKVNQPYYEQAWSKPHTLAPDRLARSRKTPKFIAFDDKYVLGLGGRTIEVHSIAGNSHHDGFALVYLPAEKILIEADAYTPAAADAPPPPAPNPYSVNLYENIERLKLDVKQIAALHGPRLATLEDLRAAISVTRQASN